MPLGAAACGCVGTTVKDSKGHYVDGLQAQDLVLYDNNVSQLTHLDFQTFPIDLVIAVQTSANSGAVIDKLGGSGILFTQLVAADQGRTAVISFSDEVKVHQDFTGEPDSVSHALRMLRTEGADAHILDGLATALRVLEQRPRQRRRIVLMKRHSAMKRGRNAARRVMFAAMRQFMQQMVPQA